MNADKLKAFLDEMRAEKSNKRELIEDEHKSKNGFLSQEEEY